MSLVSEYQIIYCLHFKIAPHFWQPEQVSRKQVKSVPWNFGSGSSMTCTIITSGSEWLQYFLNLNYRCIPEVLDSNGVRAEVFCGLPQSIHINNGVVFRLGDGRILPNPYQFIDHSNIRRSVHVFQILHLKSYAHQNYKTSRLDSALATVWGRSAETLRILYLTSLLMNLMEHTISWEVYSRSAGHEIPRLLWNKTVHLYIHKNPPLVTILCQTTPVYSPCTLYV
jgi:hypothetical protein